MKFAHWPLTGGLLHLVYSDRGGDCAGCQLRRDGAPRHEIFAISLSTSALNWCASLSYKHCIYRLWLCISHGMFRNYYSLNLHVADSRWVEVSWTLNATRLFLAPLLLAENIPLTLICPSYRLFLQTLGTDFVQRLYFAFSSVFATFSLSHIRHFLAHITRFCSFFSFFPLF